ncbi:MAG: T9SS type A sorting domain-containing protein, partial [Prevotellaceae bacterium]|nr:T9SS type A sorting domain-containing protein [Prevotellaceae bacterium]
PNPNSGEFTALVELGTVANIRLRLISLDGTVVDDRQLTGSAKYEVKYSAMHLSGIFVLQLISAKANTSLKLIVQ